MTELHQHRCETCDNFVGHACIFKNIGILSHDEISMLGWVGCASHSSVKDIQSKIRPEVYEFALRMEEKLRKNDHKGHWSREGLPYLVGRLYEEVDEFKDEWESYHIGQAMPQDLSGSYHEWQWGEVEEEAVDIANFAMMISDNLHRIKPPWEKKK